MKNMKIKGIILSLIVTCNAYAINDANKACGDFSTSSTPWVCYQGIHYDNEATYLQSINRAYNAVAEEGSYVDDFLAIPKLSDKEKANMDSDQYQNWVDSQLEQAQEMNRKVNSCARYHSLVEQQGYKVKPLSNGPGETAQFIYWDFLGKCDTLDLLRNIKPAKVSFVKNFKLNKKSINELPAELMGSFNEYIASSQEGLSIKQYLSSEDKIVIKKEGPNSLTITVYNPDGPSYINSGSRINLVARGDLIGNGQEQLLFACYPWATNDGSMGGALIENQYIVSRDKKSGLLKIIKEIEIPPDSDF
jgi:hypothetical protein